MVFYKSQPHDIRARYPIIDTILQSAGKRGVSSGKFGFNVITTANSLRCSVGALLSELYALERAGEIGVTLEDESFVVEVLAPPPVPIEAVCAKVRIILICPTLCADGYLNVCVVVCADLRASA